MTSAAPFGSDPDVGSAIDKPQVVALGGGHGLAVSLRAARQYAGELTGVVSVGDDGGSSGRLRRELGSAAPGDLRRCLSALAPPDSLLARAMEHRFDRGPLEGHPVGNLLLAGLAESAGTMEAAVAEVARLLGVDGSLLPATTGPVTLVADSDDGVLRGEVTIDRSTGIHNLRFDPARPDAPSEAVRAVERADQVIVGPGSLYTSVLAVAVVPPIRDALARTNAQVVYVANVATDRADARGFDLGAHVSALVDHGVVPDVVVAEHTSLDGEGAKFGGIPVVGASVAAADGWSHDADALAAVLGALCLDRSVGRDS